MKFSSVIIAMVRRCSVAHLKEFKPPLKASLELTFAAV
jgi:hypothetical protein